MTISSDIEIHKHNIILVAHQQYRAAAGAAIAAVNIEHHQYKAPSPASAAVAAKQQQLSQVPSCDGSYRIFEIVVYDQTEAASWRTNLARDYCGVCQDI